MDTDRDGIPDAEEDHDGDGISNWDYQVMEATPLIGMIQQGYVEQAMAMIVARADDPNAKDARGGTALMAAAEIGHTGIVEALLDAGVDVNAIDNEGKSALIIARNNGHADIVNLLIAAGAEQ